MGRVAAQIDYLYRTGRNTGKAREPWHIVPVVAVASLEDIAETYTAADLKTPHKPLPWVLLPQTAADGLPDREQQVIFLFDDKGDYAEQWQIACREVHQWAQSWYDSTHTLWEVVIINYGQPKASSTAAGETLNTVNAELSETAQAVAEPEPEPQLTETTERTEQNANTGFTFDFFQTPAG